MTFKPNINEEILTKEVILDTKYLVTCTPEIEVAKFYANFLISHPEYSIDDCNILVKIERKDEDENYYGNNGGTSKTAIIYKIVKETEKERDKRVSLEKEAYERKKKLITEICSFLPCGISAKYEDIKYVVSGIDVVEEVLFLHNGIKRIEAPISKCELTIL